MRYFAAMIIALAFVGCGEDEPADPTYDELLEGQSINWGVSGVTYPLEMDKIYCKLPSLGDDLLYACYSLDNTCGSGDGPAFCYDSQARLVGCIKGKYPIDEPLYYELVKTTNGKQQVNMSGSLDDPMRVFVSCKD